MTSDPSRKTIACVLYPGLTALDLVGPVQVLSGLGPPFQVVVVGERIEPMATDTPLKLVPDASFDEVPDPSVVVIPGGAGGTARAMVDQALGEWLMAVEERAEVVASVCTGSLVLASHGLLAGRQATTHWAFWRLLERLGAHFRPERWVEDGKYISSAGVSAGIDMSLQLAARLAGEDAARGIQLGMEYDPQPPFGGIDWDTVDRDSWSPLIMQQVTVTLADHPELVARLTS